MDVTVVIRATEERTLDLCRALMEKQAGAENVFVIKVSPFSEAVRKTFEIGLERGKTWTVAIDADVLPFPDALEIGMRQAANMGDGLYCYQGKFHDKIFGDYRNGGVKFFNTRLLDQALESLGAVKEHVRPESRTYRQMAQRGYLTFSDKRVLCLHDHEQSYRDYFRKGYFHAKKHGGNRSTANLLGFWRSKIREDFDYHVLFNGWAVGFKDAREVVNAAEFFSDIVNREFPKLNLTEKPPLEPDLTHWNKVLEERQRHASRLNLTTRKIPKDRRTLAKDYVKDIVKRQLGKYIR